MKVVDESELRDLLFTPAKNVPLEAKLAELLRQILSTAGSLRLAGIGTFRRCADGQLTYEPWLRKRVFLAYAVEDRPTVRTIYRFLRQQGFDPWMDAECLLPGQNWPRAITRSLEIADFVVPCFSRIACRKRGHFHAELRYALECSRRLPLDAVFLVPVRLEECQIPRSIQQQIQYVDLFPDYRHGLGRLVAALTPATDD